MVGADIYIHNSISIQWYCRSSKKKRLARLEDVDNPLKTSSMCWKSWKIKYPTNAMHFRSIIPILSEL